MRSDLFLGIESSCDETAIALIDGNGRVLKEAIASQVEVHAAFGGVVPEVAARAHLEAIRPLLDEVAADLKTLTAIAVTEGPGLLGALLVGTQVARALAWRSGVPLVGVNHLEGHLLAVHLQHDDAPMASRPSGDYIGLLASGGHTALYAVQGKSSLTMEASDLDISLLGQTRDDAAGEAFDKVAKLMGLGYPGGPIVDRLAASGDPKRFPFTPPMSSGVSLDFSFSGLKTAVARTIASSGIPSDEQTLSDLCAGFQSALVRVLVKKSVLACHETGINSLVLAGGVAANRGLRQHAAEQCARNNIELYIPSLQSCTDNAAMIAYAGALRYDALRARGEAIGPLVPFSRDARRLRGRFRKDGSHIERKH